MEFMKLTNFCVVCFVMFLSGLSYTLITPIFPLEALAREVTVSQSGIVMGSAFVTSFFSIPWSSFLVSQFGVRIVFIFATFVAGFANTLFGFISYTENATLYFWVSLFLRMFCAVGESLVASTAFTLGSEQFTKDRQGIAMSMVETSFGIGLVVGPSLGGLFHNYWGFSTPFWTLGVLTLVLAGFSACILKPSKLPPCKQTDRNRTKWTDVIYCPNMLLIVVVFLITGNSAGFYSASLEPYLAEKFDLTPGGVGLVLMGFSITYTITNPIVGVLLDSGFAPLRIVLMGNFITAMSFLVLGLGGPLPGISSFISEHQVAAALTFQGIGAACICMGSLAYMLECATNSKLSNTEHTKTMVSSLWLMCWYMSGSLCTSAGSKAYDLLGFGWSCFLEAVLLFIPVCWMFGNVMSSKLQSVVNQTITTESEDEDDKDLKTKLILPI